MSAGMSSLSAAKKTPSESGSAGSAEYEPAPDAPEDEAGGAEAAGPSNRA